MAKKILAFMLILALCAGICPAAFADSETAQYDNYVCLGDSITAGFTEEYVGREDLWFTASSQAYCWKIADAVGAKDIFTGTYSGARSEEIYLLLGGDAALDGYNSKGGFYEGFYNRMKGDSALAQEKVRDADLITLGIGANDICLYPIKSAGLGVDDFTGELDPVSLAAKIAATVGYIWDGYNKLMDCYPKLLDRILELNDGGRVIVTSIYNPFKSATLTDETLLPIGSAVSVVTGLVNAKIKEFAEARGIEFVDISSVESWYNALADEPVGIFDNTEDFLLYIHPTQTGYDYIARRLIGALAAESPAVSTDIVLDLSGIDAKGIRSVKINGVCVKDYTVDGDYKLTVKHTDKKALTATVESVSGGKLQIYTWTLKWTEGSGYSAYGLCKTGDLKGYVEQAGAKISNTVSALKSLFRKF